ncbi:MAG: hypothetical protein GXO74_11345 [Calditrichaeota bacterium]|nr:hypothetical protein [Calditrichota bacterium]
MKKVLTLFLLLSVFALDGMASEKTPADTSVSILKLKPITFTVEDSWFSRDKAHHFLTSAFLASAGYYYSREMSGKSEMRSRSVGVGFSLSLGILKEIRDGMQPRNDFSWKDLVADCLGTGLGILLMKE